MDDLGLVYEDGFAQGWQEGRDIGYSEGWNDARDHYEARLSKMWAELQTLNARIEFVNKQLEKQED